MVCSRLIKRVHVPCTVKSRQENATPFLTDKNDYFVSRLICYYYIIFRSELALCQKMV